MARHRGSALCLLLCALATVWAQPGADNQTNVASPKELLEALSNPAVSSIAVVKPMALPHDFGPVTVSRQLLITSPFRAVIDWCDEECNAGKVPMKPFIILKAGAMVTFNRLFFRNLIPHSSSALTASPQLDFSNSPVPFVVSQGGQCTYNLVVMHWLPAMFWVFETPGSYWAQAAKSAIVETTTRQPIQFLHTDLYTIKIFSTDGSATINDCYMPLDVDGCLTNQPFNTTLIYCPYTFKDSLKNPWVDHVAVFHNIGLDRLVNTFRNPVSVNRTVEYMSCPGTRHVMDLDNITNSVVVMAGGSLTFRNMVMQGSKSQNKTDWPSSIPLLLSTFKPMQSGTVIMRDSFVQVPNVNSLISALAQLPSGSSSLVEQPNLQPVYGGQPPKPGDAEFVIKLWQLQQQRWLTSRVGGNAILDKLGSGSMASWQFFNVTVAKYQPQDCFGGAFTQGAVQSGSYSLVSTGQELVDQLSNSSARYIKVVNDITLPGDLPSGAVTVNRIVEVRSCHPEGAYTVDWNGLREIVVVSGHAIFEGDMVMTGIHWSSGAVRSSGHVVDALGPAGMGIVAYEDLTLDAEMTSDLLGNDTGYRYIASLLAVSSLDSLPLNMTPLDDNSLLLRGFYVNRSEQTNGQVGLESFLDVNLRWGVSADRPAAGGAPIAAIVAPIVVGVAVLALVAVGAVLLMRRRRAAASGSAAEAGKPAGSGKGDLLPCVYANATGCSPDNLSRNNSDTEQNRDSMILAHKDLDRLNSVVTSTASSTSKAKSGPSQDIVQAYRNMVLHKTVNEPDELVLQSVLGEGSYGKVFRATWKGTTVAVKIMVLPSYMTGKEKREKMAVMETAISSSLSHPNVVQTYTYAVEPVRSNTTLNDRTPKATGPGASISMHDSTLSWQRKRNSGEEGAESSDSSAGAFSWEVRLVQEFCDLGSLRDVLKQGKFWEPDGSVKLEALIDTALDVARAMAHLHTHNILHSDLKARNVLLRSDAHDPRGFAAKVADFGLSLTIDPNSTHVSNAFQGTMTHMAPETLMNGKISRASDVFAYGILLWELYTGDHAYKGVPRALLGHNITKQGMRPTFPPDTPFDWQFLACRCWETDPAIRPSFEQVLQELKRMKAKLLAKGEGSSGSPSNSFLSHTLSLPSSTSQQGVPLPAPANIRAGSQQPLSRVDDASETLPTDLDQALWEAQHKQTLQQQELLRQELQRQRSGNVLQSAPPVRAGAGPGAAAPVAAAAPAAGATPSPAMAGFAAGGLGYTGASPALALARQRSDLAKQHAAALRQNPAGGKGVPAATVWGSPLYSPAGAAAGLRGDYQDRQGHAPSVYMEQTELPPYYTNENSTLAGASGLLLMESMTEQPTE